MNPSEFILFGYTHFLTLFLIFSISFGFSFYIKDSYNPSKYSTFESSLGYILILSLFGTALAKVMFNKLLDLSSPVFAVSITYLLPIVAIGWGLIDGEEFGGLQWIAALLIIGGVYLVTETKKAP